MAAYYLQYLKWYCDKNHINQKEQKKIIATTNGNQSTSVFQMILCYFPNPFKYENVFSRFAFYFELIGFWTTYLSKYVADWFEDACKRKFVIFFGKFFLSHNFMKCVNLAMGRKVNFPQLIGLLLNWSNQ